MKYSYLINIRFVALLVLVIPSMLLMNSVVVAHKSPSQDTDKSLDIERYADEPLELVEFKIEDQPIKDKIAKKYRHSSVLDTVPSKSEMDGSSIYRSGCVMSPANPSTECVLTYFFDLHIQRLYSVCRSLVHAIRT